MAFIVRAGHNYQIFHCSSEYPGYLNDIQLVTNDGEIMLLKQWQTKIPSGVPDVDLITTFVGGYCIFLMLDYLNQLCTWIQRIMIGRGADHICRMVRKCSEGYRIRIRTFKAEI